MCGVFGWLKFSSDFQDREIDAARSALRTLAHRGPDAENNWRDTQVFLGHRRLSIIDLSENASQPFSDGASTPRLSFNGEIYNFIELRETLGGLGETFTSRSDTEVLYRALCRWGTDAFARLDGMFAGGFHDPAANRHILFRDAVGQKPLYYYADSENLIYASELRALLAIPDMAWKLDAGNFYRYLANGYYAWDTTPIVGVKKLLPGHYLEIGGGKQSLVQWWNSVPGRAPLKITPGEAVDETLRHLRQACERVLRSDVPVGVFLSGGIDSSLVMALCRERDPSLRSFSLGVTEKDYDEGAKASLVAAHIGSARHTEVRISPDGLQQDLKVVLQAMDEPHADPGYINMHALAAEARKDITVALAGDGADEFFCGYLPFKTLPYVRAMELVPAPMIEIARAAAERLPSSDSYLGLKFKALSWLNGFPADASKRANLWLSTLPRGSLAKLLPGIPPDQLARLERGGFFDFPAVIAQDMHGLSATDQLCHFYQKVFLPEFVAHHTDRAAMACSLEVRSPFLSSPFMEFANRLPAEIRSRKGVTKWPLRKALEVLGFPKDIIRQRKQGFTLPLARWQRTTLRGEVLELRNFAESTPGLICQDSLDRIIYDHLEGRNNNYRILHCLMVFKAWRTRYPSLEFA